MSFEIYVGNFPSEFRKEDLSKVFQEFHGVNIKKFISKPPKCFSFLSCVDMDQILSIIKKKNGSFVCGRKLVVRAGNRELQSYVELLLQEKNSKSDLKEDCSPHSLQRSEDEIEALKINPGNHHNQFQENHLHDSFHKFNYSNVDRHDFSGSSGGADKDIQANAVSTDLNQCKGFSDTSLMPVKMKKNVTSQRNRCENNQMHKIQLSASPVNQTYAVEGNFSKSENDDHNPNIGNTLKKNQELFDQKMSVSQSKIANLEHKGQRVLDNNSYLHLKEGMNGNAHQQSYDDHHKFQLREDTQNRDVDKLNFPNASYCSKVRECSSSHANSEVNYQNITDSSLLIPLQVMKNISPKAKNGKKSVDYNQLKKDLHDSLHQQNLPCAEACSSVNAYKAEIYTNHKANKDNSLCQSNSYVGLFDSSIGHKSKTNSVASVQVSQKGTVNKLSWVSVTNFPLYTNVDSIRELFSDYDPIHIRMICNQPLWNKRLTEAHLSFSNSDVVNDVIMNFDNTMFRGRLILVNDLDDLTVMEELLAVGQF